MNAQTAVSSASTIFGKIARRQAPLSMIVNAQVALAFALVLFSALSLV
jgi:hypothetical protein